MLERMHAAEVAQIAAVERFVRNVLRVLVGSEQNLEDLGARDAPLAFHFGRQYPAPAHLFEEFDLLRGPAHARRLQVPGEPEFIEQRQHVLDRPVHRLERVGKRAVPVEEHGVGGGESRHEPKSIICAANLRRDGHETGTDLAEQGFKGFSAPAGTPKPVMDKFHAELVKVFDLPEVRKTLTETLGMDLQASTPEQPRQWLNEEMVRRGKVVKDNGIRAD
ncbi:MAG: hypothetical protein A3I63_10410 [Betaproteobacteria bacterium RIFCSPLOWO2_02_FULL_66_14]|nr:MAG: hypothetical protein A3I63_10410 [Betaproteobacteria bacterium RIFCSPLOWO2_02_FULL_66_14]